MKVIDARSGQEMRIGDTVRYHHGEQLTLVDVDEGLLSCSAMVEHVFRDVTQIPPGVSSIMNAPLVTKRSQIPLQIRLFHPSFFLQRVAFIPS